MSTIRAEMPWWRGTSGAVRASSRQKSAHAASLVQIFWPVTRQPSPSGSARVAIAARSEPAPGSLKP
jgi:hypothetical protein